MKTKFHQIGDRASKTAKTFAVFQAKVILTILYVVMALPTGLVVRISEDALSVRRHPGKPSHWRSRSVPAETLQEARRQG